MNNLISEANDLLMAAGIEQNPELLREAVNKISVQISQALMPLNPMNLPFVTAVLLSYTELLEKQLKPDQYEAFFAMRLIMKDDAEKYTLKIPITDIKGNNNAGCN
nr:MAG TPA: hypothetical protein [Caudoviricetes sp.]